MLKKKNRAITNQVEFVSISDLVPKDHLLRAVEESIDFDFIYDEVKDLYSENIGRPSIDPVVLIKLLMLQALYGIRSMRQTIKEVEVNVAYRWFLGYGLQEQIPHFSTFGKNYERRFKESDLFEKIFVHILMEAIKYGFIKSDAVFIDATHVKASANKNKYVKKMAQHRAHKYKRELLIEINADREANGKKPFEDSNDNNKDGDSPKKDSVKEIKESTTDPESGMFHKGEKERCFAYTASVACDRNNFILGVKVAPGNIHDSQVFSDLFQEVSEKFPEIEAVVVDAGYKTPGVCREIIEAGKLPVMPYKRPMTKDGYFKKRDYVYDEYYDCYLCPNNQVLRYSTTNRAGYREYKSDPKICSKCPMRMQCTLSKSCTKVVTRHVWEHYMEIAEDIRHTPWGKELYKMRGETIERVFADAKEKHGMRYTNLRGLRKVGHYLTLLFACINLKKLALWKKKQGMLPPAVPVFSLVLSKIRKIFTFNQTPLLSLSA
ncbi:Transposase [Desulforamulus putei DSM 12395]|uniref:Transposase n=3 Tax=Desulforamulus putei DSM 12395 TaxID=1121429 RepID=A0A1M4ZL88_9FIRM|nr:IS1182 family transposase [Desulforamulus putei]SHF18557.1 Transposase [Desulforamulus putei DSM 12395]SHF52773.1 Transposase [Desulforamulus putei DSM 12395]